MLAASRTWKVEEKTKKKSEPSSGSDRILHNANKFHYFINIFKKIIQIFRLIFDISSWEMAILSWTIPSPKSPLALYLNFHYPYINLRMGTWNLSVSMSWKINSVFCNINLFDTETDKVSFDEDYIFRPDAIRNSWLYLLAFQNLMIGPSTSPPSSSSKVTTNSTTSFTTPMSFNRSDILIKVRK